MRAYGLAKWALGAAVSMVGLAAAVADPAAPPLVPYEIVGDGIPKALTDGGGDASSGRALFVDRDRGHCLLCHVVASIDEPFQGTLGPDLSTVGDRLSTAQLRLRLVDSTLLNPDTVMPAYYRVHDLRQVGEAYVGKPVLGARQIEDVVAYLGSLQADEADE